MLWWCLCIYSRNHVRICDLQYRFFCKIVAICPTLAINQPLPNITIFTDRHWIPTYFFTRGWFYLSGGVYSRLVEVSVQVESTR